MGGLEGFLIVYRDWRVADALVKGCSSFCWLRLGAKLINATASFKLTNGLCCVLT